MAPERVKLHPQGCKSRIIEMREFTALYLESAEGNRVALGIHLEGEVGIGQPSCVIAAMSLEQAQALNVYLTGVIDQAKADGNIA